LFARKILTEKPRFLGHTGALATVRPPLHPAAGAGDKTVVDWRNRYGRNWITRIRDQDPCEHCWIYAPTALIEAMVRIEHCVWCARSEGDYIEANKVTLAFGRMKPLHWRGRLAKTAFRPMRHWVS